MWFWGNDDAPGADKWLAAAVKSYEAKNPNIKIKVVTQPVGDVHRDVPGRRRREVGPRHRRAVGDRAGADAGLGRRDHGDLRPRAEVGDEELAEHVGENTYAGKIWAMPLYLIGIPWMYNKALMKQAGITDYPATKWSQIISYCKTLRAKNIVPFAFGNDTFWTTQLMTQDLEQARATSWRPTPARRASPTKKYAHFEDGWKQMVDAKCFNDDVVVGRRSPRASRPSTRARPR